MSSRLESVYRRMVFSISFYVSRSKSDHHYWVYYLIAYYRGLISYYDAASTEVDYSITFAS
jgi:hypothetical protein